MNLWIILTLVGVAIANLLLSISIGQQAYHWMPPQASAEAVLVDHLFSLMVTIGSFIFIGVMGALLYSILFFRASKDDLSDGPPIEGNNKLEIVWTIIPILLVILIGTSSFRTFQQMEILGRIKPLGMGMATAEAVPLTPDAETPIEVYARQWAWEFRYPQQNISTTELHLPINQRAKLLLMSEDVLHGFYVPAFRIKQDVVPGREIAFEFTPIKEGKYRLRDSEYSGTYFATNQSYVVVESPENYKNWLIATASHPLTPAPNSAFNEFQEREKNPVVPQWKSVQPASPPLVNFSD